MNVETAPERHSTAVERPAALARISSVRAAVRIAVLGVLAVALLHDVLAAVDQSSAWAADFASYYVPAHTMLQFPSVDVYNIGALRQLNAAHQLVPRVFFPYLYPPAALYLLSPIAALPFDVANVLWSVLSHLAALGSALLLADAFAQVLRRTAPLAAPDSLLAGTQRVVDGSAVQLGRWRAPLVPFAVCAVTVLFAYPTIDTYDLGQINLVVLFFLMLALHSHIYDRLVLAGVAIAIAGALKLTPLLFLAFFVARGAWKAVVSGLVFSALFAAVPLFLLSPHAYVAFAAQLQMVDKDFVPYLQNQSLVGALLHLGKLSAHLGPRSIALVQQGGELLGIGLAAASIGYLILMAWRRGELTSGGPPRAARLDLDWLGFAFVILAYMLATPLIWTHVYVVALPAALMLGVYPLLRTRPDGAAWDRTDSVLLFCGLIALGLFMVQLPLGADHGLGPAQNNIGLALLMLRALGTLIAWGALVALLAPRLRRA